MPAQADPPPSQALWPDPDHGPWLLVLHWSRLGGRIECTGLELRSARRNREPAGSLLLTHDVEPTRLTTTVLRALPFATTVQATKRDMGHFTEWWAGLPKGRLEPDPNLAPPPAELVQRAEEWRRSARGRGGAPPQYGPEHFARVAEVYQDATNAGRSDPRQAVREWAAASTPSMAASSSAVAKWIARARQMGLLEPTTRGRTRL